MAQKGKASSKTTVRRIKATDDAPKKEKAVAKKINKPTKITTKAPISSYAFMMIFLITIIASTMHGTAIFKSKTAITSPSTKASNIQNTGLFITVTPFLFIFLFNQIQISYKRLCQ